MNPPSSHANSPVRRRRRVLLKVAIPLAGVAGLLWIFSPARAPAWWEKAAKDALGFSGESVENRLLTEATLVRPMTDGVSAPWSVRLTQEEANAWLRERLPAWIAHGALDKPLVRECQSLRLAFGPGRVVAGFERGSVVISGALSTTIREGNLWLKIGSIKVGSLPVPGRAVSGLADAGGVLRGERSAAKTSFDLEDGRVIEVLAIDLSEGLVEVRARTRARQR